jgi:protein-tyrosine phosphatase
MDDPSNLDLYEAAQIPYRWLPTRGGTAPSLEQIAAFCQFVDAETAAGHAVAVHCSSGRRRTATFLGAYMILSGASYEEDSGGDRPSQSGRRDAGCAITFP